MAQYDFSYKKRLLEIPISQILYAMGKPNNKWPGNMYLSPFRDEDTPSFHVDPRRNVWYDFGEGKGGGVIDLVCKLNGCSRADAYDYLNSISSINYIDHSPAPLKNAKRFATKKEGKENHIHILNSNTAFSKNILAYAHHRCISEDVLKKYCRMIEFTIDSYPDVVNEAIGFENNNGGVVLRSETMKLCTSSTITTLSPSGSRTDKTCTDNAFVFEGFIDFLSWLSCNNKIEPGEDCCILNSVNNISHALEWIGAHRKVAAFTDNDAAGEKAYEVIIEAMEYYGNATDKEVIHMASKYRDYKDINEMYMTLSQKKP